MVLARNLLLAVTAAVAAMAFLATSAFAQSVEVVEEDLGHCPDNIVEEAGHNISGGCQVGLATESPTVWFVHTGSAEAVTLSCQSNMIATINEEGTGYIDVDANTIVESEATGCVIEPCDEGEAGTTPHADFEWPISAITEYGLSREAMLITYCIRPHAPALPEGSTFQAQVCTVEVDITLENPPIHQYEFRANEEPCLENPAVEQSFHWLTNDADGDRIEINHIHYPFDNP